MKLYAEANDYLGDLEAGYIEDREDRELGAMDEAASVADGIELEREEFESQPNDGEEN